MLAVTAAGSSSFSTNHENGPRPPCLRARWPFPRSPRRPLNRSLVIPGQADGGAGGRGDSFFAAGKAEAFAGSCLHSHARDVEPCDLGNALAEACKSVDVKTHRGGTYLCMEGPAFSTVAESNVYRSWGMDIIGMTNLQEAKLAREAEICYATLALVTDYDCWHPAHDAVTVETVIEYLNKNVRNAQTIMRAAVKALASAPRGCGCASALKNAIFTAPDNCPEATARKLDAIIGKYNR